MIDNFRQALEELKDVMLNLHRSASNLDTIITEIENEIYNNDDLEKDFLKIFVEYQQNHREDSEHRRGFKELNCKEKEIWNKLIESLK